jgi:polar amino acid transport system substrate-binding protein
MIRAGLRSLFALALCLCVPAAPARAQAGASAAPAKLVVGTMRIPPFVLRSDDGHWSGLSIDLWKQVAAEMRVPFEYRE